MLTPTSARWRAFVALLLFWAIVCSSAPRVALAVDKPAPPPSRPDDNGIRLTASDAKIQGANARLEGITGQYVSWWMEGNTTLNWTAPIQKPGKYRVELDYCVIGDRTGGPLRIRVGDEFVRAVPRPGAASDGYTLGTAGEVTIGKPGNLQVVMNALPQSRVYVIHIRSLALVPAEFPGSAADISGGPIRPSGDGSIRLVAADAEINGSAAKLEGDSAKNIGGWQDVGTSLAWSVEVRKPGKYRVEMNYALSQEDEGSKVAISVDGQTVKAKPKAGHSGMDYIAGSVGEIAIRKAGTFQVVMKPLSKPHGCVLNLRSLFLVPAQQSGTAPDIRDVPIQQEADGGIRLGVANAEIDGEAAKWEGGNEGYLLWWNSLDRGIRWPVAVTKTGRFTVELTYALAGEQNGEVEFDPVDKKFPWRSVAVAGGMITRRKELAR